MVLGRADGKSTGAGDPSYPRCPGEDCWCHACVEETLVTDEPIDDGETTLFEQHALLLRNSYIDCQPKTKKETSKPIPTRASDSATTSLLSRIASRVSGEAKIEEKEDKVESSLRSITSTKKKKKRHASPNPNASDGHRPGDDDSDDGNESKGVLDDTKRSRVTTRSSTGYPLLSLFPVVPF